MASQGMTPQALSSAVEALYEDERLRSELTDDEASILLGWAEAQLTQGANSPAARAGGPDAEARFQEYVQRVRNAARDVNDLAGERTNLADGEFLVRLISMLSPGGGVTRALPDGARDLVAKHATMDGKEFIKQLTALITDSWRIAGGSGSGTGGREQDGQDEVRREGRAKGGEGGPRPVAGGSGSGGGIGSGPMVLLGVILVVALLIVVAMVFLPRQPQSTPTAAPQPTAVGSTGWYQLYFTTPRFPDVTSDHEGSLDEKLTAFINTATKSVDMAIYQLDLDNVTKAMLDAKTRGATVRVVTDVDILNDPKENPSFKKLQAAGITVVGGNPNAIMHDKFVVVDQKAVWMGSWNFTTNDTYRYNNNGILIQSPELAKNYTVTFEKMWRDKLFGGQRKPGGTTPKLTIGGVAVESYFAPEDGVTEKIVNRLKAAQKTIDFMAFSFTDDEIGATVSGRAKAGVKVRGVFEKTGSETQFSEFGRMKSAGLDVLQDGNPYLMHHKVFVIDGKTTIVGSFNFSQNAENSNDENLLIVDEDAMAASFTQEFERVRAQALNPPSARDRTTGTEREKP